MSIVEYIQRELRKGYLDGYKAQALGYMSNRTNSKPEHHDVAMRMSNRSSEMFKNRTQRSKLYNKGFYCGTIRAELRAIRKFNEKIPPLYRRLVLE